jgi:aryl-alcohol dehydrogenase-like predicted oxidoreductase
MRLALGTVQFGTDYGAFNPDGRLDEAGTAACLDRAEAAGIDLLDTARAYGDSEEVLGRLDAAKRFRLVTKVAPLAGAGSEDVRRSIEASLARLRTDRVHGLLLHSAADLLGPQGDDIWRTIEELVSQGTAAKGGVSIYAPEEAATLVARYPIAIVQAPYSAFDQRLKSSGLLAELQERGVEVHVRSIFLQGFALADPDTLPPPLDRHRARLACFRTAAATLGLSPLQLALAAALAEPGIDRIIVGVRSPADLEEILAAASGPLPLPDLDACVSDDLALINPASWTTRA